MGRMNGVPFQGFSVLKRRVQHHIRVGRRQELRSHGDLQEARDLSLQPLKAFFNPGPDFFFLFLRVFILQLSQNNMLNHRNLPFFFSVSCPAGRAVPPHLLLRTHYIFRKERLSRDSNLTTGALSPVREAG